MEVFESRVAGGTIDIRPLSVDAVVAHQISATQTHRHRLATQGLGGRAWPLRVDVQVRLSRIAAVTEKPERGAARRAAAITGTISC